MFIAYSVPCVLCRFAKNLSFTVLTKSIPYHFFIIMFYSKTTKNLLS